MKGFVESTPTLENYWRSIILFGSNVASYKFALARALLSLGPDSGTVVPLETLAEPFSREIARHLSLADKQATSRSSRFLDACRAANAGSITQAKLNAETVRLGFANVIDAFHIVNRRETPVRFFEDDRRASGGIRLTDDFFRLKEGAQTLDLPHEAEARWRLVETAWSLDMSRNVVAVDSDLRELIIAAGPRRLSITSSRHALNGYQKGRCFYCFRVISVESGSESLADVDHFLPHVLMRQRVVRSLDGIWNLVLACGPCNRGPAGKMAQVPATPLLERLHRRNEYLIESHHPLRETLIQQTGASEPARRAFLQQQWNEARWGLIHVWVPAQQGDAAF